MQKLRGVVAVAAFLGAANAWAAGDKDERDESAADIQRTMKDAQRAFDDITAARVALNDGNSKKARQHLGKARKVLDRLYGAAPMSSAVEAMDKASADIAAKKRGVAFAPIRAEFGEAQVYVDPEVVAGIDRAEEHYRAGRTHEAGAQLRLARQSLVAELALLPVETAYARVVAADTLLREGNIEDARRLLGGMPITVAQYEVTAPLVPVRLNLRAAAEAAEAEDWKRTEQLIDRAATQIKDAQANATAETRADLKPLVDDVVRMQKAADGAKQVDPDELRSLATRIVAPDED